MPERFSVIGHRGFPAVAPENTLASFRAAIHAGADMIEFDVMLTRDGVPVVFHDRTLGRTTGGRGRVAKTPLAKLRVLDAGGWFSSDFTGERVPTLEETLDLAAGKIRVNIEIKKEAVSSRLQGGVEEKVAALVSRKKLESDAVISSFLPLAIRRIKRINPRLTTALLLSRPLRGDPRKVLGAAEADALHLSRRRLTQAAVRKVKEAGIPLRVYTVDDPAAARKLKDWGVDGVFTNDVARILKAVRA